jgi:hypothetical protein
VCLVSPPLVSPHLTDDLGPLLSGSCPARFSVALVVPCLSSSPGWAGAHRRPRIPRGGGESVARATTAEFRATFLDPSRPRILRIKSNASVFVSARLPPPSLLILTSVLAPARGNEVVCTPMVVMVLPIWRMKPQFGGDCSPNSVSTAGSLCSVVVLHRLRQALDGRSGRKHSAHVCSPRPRLGGIELRPT